MKQFCLKVLKFTGKYHFMNFDKNFMFCKYFIFSLMLDVWDSVEQRFSLFFMYGTQLNNGLNVTR